MTPSEIDRRADAAEGIQFRSLNAGVPLRGGIWRQNVEAFRELWDSVNAKRAPWASNPWVWVLTFRRVTA